MNTKVLETTTALVTKYILTRKLRQRNYLVVFVVGDWINLHLQSIVKEIMGYVDTLRHNS